MKIQALAVVVVVAVLSSRVAGDTKVVAPWYATAAAVPTFKSTAFHYAVPRVVQYSVPHAVQYVAAAPAVQAVPYSAPQTVQYRAVSAVPAVAAVGAAPLVYSASYTQPAAAVVGKVDVDDDDDVSAVAVVRSAPTVYSASFSQPAVAVVGKANGNGVSPVAAVRSPPTVYSPSYTYSQPAFSVVRKVEFDDDDDDDVRPLTYAAGAVTHDLSLEEFDDDDVKWASPYSKFDGDWDDRYDFDDDRK